MNNGPGAERPKSLKHKHLESGTTLAKGINVKRSITFREITVAIGVLVAVVIALTLWMGIPDLHLSEADTTLRPGVSFTLKNFLESSRAVFAIR